MKRNILITLGLATVITLAACTSAPAAQNSQATAASGTKVTVTKGTVQTTIIATGNVIARDIADVVFQRAGLVTSVHVNPGDKVTAGQPLVSLDDSSLKLTAQQQYASYLSAQAAYSQTIEGPSASDLASAQTALVAAQAAYSQTVQGATSFDIASAKAALASAASAYNDLLQPPDANSVASLKAALDNAKAALDQAQSAYDNAYRRDPAGIGASPAALSLQQATNNYLAAKANYDKAFAKPANGTLTNARAQIVAAQAKLDALTPTNQQIAQAAANVAAAQAKLDGLTPTPETIIQAKAKLDQAYIAWQQAEQDVHNATILAPYDGLVMQVTFNVGDWANAGTSAVQVADVNKLLFEVAVDESDMGNVKVGQPAIVQLGAYAGVPISATVATIAPEGTNSGSSVTFKVDLVLGGVIRGTGTGSSQARQGNPSTGQRQSGQSGTNPTNTQTGQDGTTPVSTQSAQSGLVILLGMSGTSQVITAQATNTVVVPNGALVVDRTTRSYTVERVTASGQVETVPVKLGLRGTTETQIIDGLNDGDVILVPRTATTAASGGAFVPGVGRVGGGAPFRIGD